MKTEYILHGGYTNEDNELNLGFFTKIVESVPEDGSILLIYFASDDIDIDTKFLKDTARLKSIAAHKQIFTKIATKENFINEIKTADVIYIRGGSTQKLKYTLDTYPNFCESIKGKTISGSSAGAYVLSEYYYSNSQNKVMQGYSCVPARIACHYKSKIHPISDLIDPVKELEKYNNDLELILLKDYEWIVRKV